MDVIKEENVQEEQKINKILEDIVIAISNNDKQKINDFINQLLSNVRKLNKDCNKDVIGYYIFKFLMRFFVTFPGVRVSACENFDTFLTKALDSVKFEKNSLQDLKKYLIFCKKNENYDQILFSFILLLTIVALRNNRVEVGKVNANILNCGMSGITYVPSSSLVEDNMDSLQETINENLAVLKKAKSKS